MTILKLQNSTIFQKQKKKTLRLISVDIIDCTIYFVSIFDIQWKDEDVEALDIVELVYKVTFYG